MEKGVQREFGIEYLEAQGSFLEAGKPHVDYKAMNVNLASAAHLIRL